MMKHKLFIPLFLVAAFISQGKSAQAQDTVRRTVEIGKLDSLNSTILKEKRRIEVFVPKNDQPGSNTKYDVLYVLDGGNWNTGLISKIQGFLEGEKYMPPTIIVSILGIDRNKDLTPTHIDGWKTSGGATQFLGFIKDELIPYINQKYPANGDNAIWGHSLGGLFVVNALLVEPKTFKSYIAVDPSLWWDNNYIQKIASLKLAALQDPAVTLFMSGREGKEGETMKIDAMDSLLKKWAPAGLTWKSIRYPEETHSSVRFKSTYDGLKFSYGWQDNEINFHPMNGIVLKNKPVAVWYFGDTTRVRYTTDGTNPTLGSAKIQSDIIINDGAKITVKQFTNRARYDQVKTGNFTKGKILTPISKPKNLQPGGFHYDYYEGDFNKAEDLKNKSPQKSGLTNADFEVEKLPRKNNFALIIEGVMETKEEGYYGFVLEADKGSKLYLNDQLLIQWEDHTKRNSPYSYILPLTKGFYKLRLEYLHQNKDAKLKLNYLPPSLMSTKKALPIPFDLQFGTLK
ncbi:alpha/beta hydrolase-fold protein [Pedobacter polysacchareus]|uniref:alpha/beta hydrolase-fold protein n=1 Tax=Pedobacter polysacchareus TaxID=2861973 RepID=UPI001C99A98E|nr:alpha/beta hydrolase-fold protein [Pedobacter polysacchareus]